MLLTSNNNQTQQLIVVSDRSISSANNQSAVRLLTVRHVGQVQPYLGLGKAWSSGLRYLPCMAVSAQFRSLTQTADALTGARRRQGTLCVTSLWGHDAYASPQTCSGPTHSVSALLAGDHYQKSHCHLDIRTLDGLHSFLVHFHREDCLSQKCQHHKDR